MAKDDLTHEDVVRALTIGYSGEEWGYVGDGSTLGEMTHEETGEVWSGLTWHSKKPKPRIETLRKILKDADKK